MVVPVILELGVALETVEIIMNEQAGMMADFAEEHDIHFLDLTPSSSRKRVQA